MAEDRKPIEDPQRFAERVETLFAELEAHPDPKVREVAIELLGVVMSLHRQALAKILELAKSAHSSEEILAAMSRDPVVSTVLLGHDLMPQSLEERVEAALDKTRSYQHSHGGDVELVSVENGVVKLRLQGACHGCGSSLITLKAGIEKAIREAVPEVVEIQVEGLPTAKGEFVSIDQVGGKRKGWRDVVNYEEIPFGQMRAFDVDGESALFCRAFGSVYAFLNACPEGERPLDGGTLEAFVLTCGCHGYSFDIRSGRCINRSELSLDPLPIVWDKGRLRVAV